MYTVEHDGELDRETTYDLDFIIETEVFTFDSDEVYLDIENFKMPLHYIKISDKAYCRDKNISSLERKITYKLDPIFKDELRNNLSYTVFADEASFLMPKKENLKF